MFQGPLPEQTQEPPEILFACTYQNLPDLQPNTWTLIRFQEIATQGGKWLFRKDGGMPEKLGQADSENRFGSPFPMMTSMAVQTTLGMLTQRHKKSESHSRHNSLCQNFIDIQDTFPYPQPT